MGVHAHACREKHIEYDTYVEFQKISNLEVSGAKKMHVLMR